MRQPGRLFYVDPPYLSGTRNRRWNDPAHAHVLADISRLELHSMLRGIKGKDVSTIS